MIDLRGEEAVAELGDRAKFVETDVTDEAAVTAALDIAESLGPLRINVNCAGIGNAIKTLGKDGPFPLDAFRKVVEVNLIGTFNVMRLSRRAHRQDRADRRGARRHHQHRVGRGVRRPDRPGRLLGVQGRRGRHDAADRPRPVARADPRGHHRARACSRPRCWPRCPRRRRQSLGKQVPHPARLGEPDEYGALAVHIVENPMLNGEVIRLDGAIRMAPMSAREGGHR